MMQEENKRPDEQPFSSADATEDALNAFEQVAAPQRKSAKKRMNSNTRLLIIVTSIVAALAILLAVLLPLLSEGPGGSSITSSDATSALEQVYPLYDRSADKTEEKIVQSVKIKNKNDEYTIRYNVTDKVYQLDGYSDLSLSESDIEMLVNNATALNGYDKVNIVEKLADFGLDNPSITVTITYYDNAIVTLLIGNETPDKNGYYAYLQGEDEVVMINADSVSCFQLKKGQYLERNLIVAPSVKTDDANGTAVLYELTVNGRDEQPLSLRQIATSDGEEYSYSAFVITKPYKRTVSETVSSSLAAFTYLVANEGIILHPNATDKAKYGFNDPYAVIDVTLAIQTTKEKTESSTDTDNPEYIYYNSATSKITVGSKDAYGNYYVMVNDTNAIYLVSYSSLSVIAERTYANTIGELLFLKNIVDVKQISISTDSKTYDFMLTHDQSKEETNEQLSVMCDGQKFDTSDFRTLYSRMMSISRYGETETQPSGQPLHKIVLVENSGEIFLSIEIFEYSSSLYTIRTNEGELFTVKASDINAYMNIVKDYLAGKSVPRS